MVIFRIATAAVRRFIIAAIGIIGPRVIGIAVGNSAIAIGIRRNTGGMVSRVVVVVVWIVVVWVVGVRVVVVWVVVVLVVIVRVVVVRVVVVLVVVVLVVVWIITRRRVVRTIVCTIRALTVGVGGIFWSPRIVSLWASYKIL